jgi:hypothetical protein
MSGKSEFKSQGLDQHRVYKLVTSLIAFGWILIIAYLFAPR